MWQRRDPVLVVMYVMMIAGAVWHSLGWFDNLMRWLSGPMLIGFGVGVLLQVRRRATPLFWLWAVCVLMLSFMLEWVGVHTGRPFGKYLYTDILQPQWNGVPLAIAFSWLMLLLGSAKIVQRCGAGGSRLLSIFCVAILMTLFDLVMEPAAVRLGYWTWQKGSIPLQNFIVWFVASSLFGAAGSFMHLDKVLASRRLIHFYLTPLLYFLLVLIFN
jgi:putative membrane protein